MPTIKRYPNRKLYDTEGKRYITLDEIARLIRRGEGIHVVDNTSGEDLTSLTLTQIVLEQEKKQSGFLPHTVLASLIQSGGDRLEAFHRALFSSMPLNRLADEEIQRRIRMMVNLGELAEDEGQSLAARLLSLARLNQEQGASSEQDLLERLFEKLNIPTRDEINKLVQQLEELAVKLDEIDQSKSSA